MTMRMRAKMKKISYDINSPTIMDKIFETKSSFHVK